MLRETATPINTHGLSLRGKERRREEETNPAGVALRLDYKRKKIYNPRMKFIHTSHLARVASKGALFSSSSVSLPPPPVKSFFLVSLCRKRRGNDDDGADKRYILRRRNRTLLPLKSKMREDVKARVVRTAYFISDEATLLYDNDARDERAHALFLPIQYEAYTKDYSYTQH